MDNPAFVTENGKGSVLLRKIERINGNEDGFNGSAVRGEGPHIPRTEIKAEALAGSEPAPDDTVNLKRRVGLFSGVALIVGTMIGSGIFVSPTGVLSRTGSAGLSLVIWAACGILSLFGALSYAELGTLINDSGGEYIYLLRAFSPSKKKHKLFWAEIPPYLFSWTSIFLLKPASFAIITLSASEYLVRSFRIGCSSDDANIWAYERNMSVKLITAAIMIIITFINSFSVKLATKVQNIFTAAKLIAIAIIVIGGIVKLAQGNVQYLSNGFEGSTTNLGSIATAFYSGLWAYDGWNNLNYVTEELKRPHTNLPRAIMIAIPLVTICYVMVNIAYLAVMSTDELLASETVAVLYGSRMFGNIGEALMILSVTFSTFGSANGSCFTAGRLCLVAAREGHMIDALSYIHVRKLTPAPALLFNAFIALLMIIPSNIGSLIDFFNFSAWIFYGGAMMALLVMRYTKKDEPRPYKVPTIIPIIVLIVSVYLVAAPIIESPQIEYLYASMFIVAGLVFYVPFVYYQMTVPGMGHFTTFFQLLLEVVPSDKIPDL